MSFQDRDQAQRTNEVSPIACKAMMLKHRERWGGTQSEPFPYWVKERDQS